jgi:hypothetical protein
MVAPRSAGVSNAETANRLSSTLNHSQNNLIMSNSNQTNPNGVPQIINNGLHHQQTGVSPNSHFVPPGANPYQTPMLYGQPSWQGN